MKSTRYTFADLTRQIASWNNTLQEVGTNARITLGRAYNCNQVYLSEVTGDSPADSRTWSCIRQITSGTPRECLEAGKRVYREEIDRARTAKDAGAIAELNERLKERTAACLASESKLNRRVAVLEQALRDLLDIANAQLDQSATHSGLLNCDALAKARAALNA